MKQRIDWGKMEPSMKSTLSLLIVSSKEDTYVVDISMHVNGIACCRHIPLPREKMPNHARNRWGGDKGSLGQENRLLFSFSFSCEMVTPMRLQRDSQLACLLAGVSLPNRIFHKFRAMESVERRIAATYCSSISGFSGCEIVKCSVG